jgi:hypothetical protein
MLRSVSVRKESRCLRKEGLLDMSRLPRLVGELQATRIPGLVLIIAMILCLLSGTLAFSAKTKQVCPSEGWELYAEGEALEGSFVDKGLKKKWKEAGKPVFDREARPYPYATIFGPKGIAHKRCALILRYIDGEKVEGNGDLRVGPGEHTLVVELSYGQFSATHDFEFTATFEAAMEYQIQALIQVAFFRGNEWSVVMHYRKHPDYPESDRE